MPRMCWTVLLGTMLLGSQLGSAAEPLLPASTCPCQVKGCAQPRLRRCARLLRRAPPLL